MGMRPWLPPGTLRDCDRVWCQDKSAILGSMGSWGPTVQADGCPWERILPPLQNSDGYKLAAFLSPQVFTMLTAALNILSGSTCFCPGGNPGREASSQARDLEANFTGRKEKVSPEWGAMQLTVLSLSSPLYE